MSRIGKVPVVVPKSVKVELAGNNLKVSGKLGQLSFPFNEAVQLDYDKTQITVKPANDTTQARAMWGLSRTLVSNMVKGVDEGFIIRLEVTGVGFRCAVDKAILTLFLGYSHEIKLAIPDGITIICEKPTLLVISGADKQKVGQIAAVIKKLRKSDPYKGKGIKAEGEKIRRKEGKKK